MYKKHSSLYIITVQVLLPFSLLQDCFTFGSVTMAHCLNLRKHLRNLHATQKSSYPFLLVLGSQPQTLGCCHHLLPLVVKHVTAIVAIEMRTKLDQVRSESAS